MKQIRQEQQAAAERIRQEENWRREVARLRAENATMNFFVPCSKRPFEATTASNACDVFYGPTPRTVQEAPSVWLFTIATSRT